MGLKKQIIQFKDGEQVAIYESATEAAKAVGSINATISKCCLGKIKQVNGYTFKYTGEYTNKIEHNGEYKCPYCDERFESYIGLAHHVLKYKSHGDNITREQLLTDFKYGGVRPTCKCGCGGYTSIRYEGEPHFQNYIVGHHNRVHNNWGHNEKAKLHSAETRRKQYASGERVQWNKGKKWGETFSKEKIKELMKMYSDKKRNEKISKASKGVPKSKEHAERCRENGRSEKSIIANRIKMHKALTSGEFSLSSKIEKEFIETCIKPLGIEFDTQHYMKDIHHYCDVYIPSKNIIIEFQGDYWHGNPKKYTKDELSKFQLEKVEKDEVLREYCKNNGIILIEIWESDYNRDTSGVKQLLEESIK